MKIRPATSDDLIGRFAFDGVVPFRMRAMVLEHDGQVLAIGGMARTERASGFNEAFSLVDPKAREIPGGRVALGRLARAVRDEIIKTSSVVLAFCDPNEPTSPSLLAWCGFEQLGKEVWRMKNETRGA